MLDNCNIKPIFYSRLLSLICFIVFNIQYCFAQETVEEIATTVDTLSNEYIIDHKKQFNVKLEVGNEISSFSLIENDIEADLKPSLNLRYAVVLSYKFLSVRIGIRPKISEEQKEQKGGSDTFRLKFQSLFDNWNHVIEYNIDKGYYVANTGDFIDIENGIRIQFPEMSSNILYGTSSYKFNKKYSMRAFQSQTEIQVKSAGSFMPGISYSFYSITGTDIVKDGSGERLNRDYYNEYNGFNIALSVGYYYTFVIKKYWFANAYAVPNAGIDIYKTTVTTPQGSAKFNSNQTFLALNYGFGGGYNGDKIFFGAEIRNRLTNEKLSSDKVRITPQQNHFSVYFGYRFKAPKTISKPVDLIEKKVPILKDNPK